MSEDSYFIFNLIDNLEENMSNCDKMLDIEKVKMFDKIADIVKKTEMSDKLDIFSNLNFISSNIRLLSTMLINNQSDLSSLLEDVFYTIYIDNIEANTETLEIVRNILCDIKTFSEEFKKIESKLENKIQDLK